MPLQTGKTMSQEQFFSFLEQEMRKIEQFTKKQVTEIRKVLADAERRITMSAVTENLEELETLQTEVEKAGEEFLKLVF
jgi:hypothetical protein